MLEAVSLFYLIFVILHYLFIQRDMPFYILKNTDYIYYNYNYFILFYFRTKRAIMQKAVLLFCPVIVIL